MGHSITDTICTDGIPVSIINFNSSVIHAEGTSATFGAGIRIKEAMGVPSGTQSVPHSFASLQ
jgi:hypothetical protein